MGWCHGCLRAFGFLRPTSCFGRNKLIIPTRMPEFPPCDAAGRKPHGFLWKHCDNSTLMENEGSVLLEKEPSALRTMRMGFDAIEDKRC